MPLTFCFNFTCETDPKSFCNIHYQTAIIEGLQIFFFLFVSCPFNNSGSNKCSQQKKLAFEAVFSCSLAEFHCQWKCLLMS